MQRAMKSISIVVIAIFLVYSHKTLADSSIPMSQAESLKRNLTAQCSFLQSFQWPAQNGSNATQLTPVDVWLQFEPTKFMFVEDGAMAFVTRATVIWQYPSCAAWSTSVYQYAISLRFELAPSAKTRLWTPSITQTNNVEDPEIIDRLLSESNLMTLNSNGMASVEISGIIQSSCTNYGNQLISFPFDQQTCQMVFQSKHDNRLVNLLNGNFISDKNVKGNLSTDFIDTAEVWGCLGHTASADLATDRGLQYSRITFTLNLQRRPTIVIYSVILPSGALMVLQIGSFAMPSRLPERPLFSVTVLLAFYILQTIVDDTVPETSSYLMIKINIVGQIAMAVFCTVYFSITCTWSAHLHVVERHLDETKRRRVCGIGIVAFIDSIFFAISAIGSIALYFGPYGYSLQGFQWNEGENQC